MVLPRETYQRPPVASDVPAWQKVLRIALAIVKLTKVLFCLRYRLMYAVTFSPSSIAAWKSMQRLLWRFVATGSRQQCQVAVDWSYMKWPLSATGWRQPAVCLLLISLVLQPSILIFIALNIATRPFEISMLIVEISMLIEKVQAVWTNRSMSRMEFRLSYTQTVARGYCSNAERMCASTRKSISADQSQHVTKFLFCSARIFSYCFSPSPPLCTLVSCVRCQKA